MKNYYEILEVSKNASPEIIEKAYKTLAKKYHPDVCEEEKKAESEKLFKEVGEAYDILSDAEKKAEYDTKYEKFILGNANKSNPQHEKQYNNTSHTTSSTNSNQPENIRFST